MKALTSIFIMTLALTLLAGCTSFKKSGDNLIKSPCEVCKRKPFYINGKRV